VERQNLRGRVRFEVVKEPDALRLQVRPDDADETRATLRVEAPESAGDEVHEVRLRAAAGDRQREQTVRVTVATPPRLRLLPVAAVTLDAGQSRTVPVQVERHKAPGPVTLTLHGLPAGVQAAPARIDAGSDRGAVELTAASDAAASRTVTLRAAAGDVRAEKEFALVVKEAGTFKTSVGLELVLIPKEKFMMGSPPNEEGRYDNEGEKPHEVEITQPFYLGKYTVTRGQFRQFVQATGYKTDAEKGEKGWNYGYDAEKKSFEDNPKYNWLNPGFAQTDEHPVVLVSWNDAVAFCAWLEKKEGKKYRLPTEAEWEYSCRAGTTTRFYSGDADDSLKAVANIADASFKAKYPAATWAQGWDDDYPFTAPVGKFQKNAFGLYDMHGNVWQWCQDWYGSDYYKNSPRQDPQGPGAGASRVVRGGSFRNAPRTLAPPAATASRPRSGTAPSAFVCCVCGRPPAEPSLASDYLSSDLCVWKTAG
jgi:formylglycine-generating enzyme required for sulfatase activity